MTEADMQGLRDHGFSDEKVLHMVCVCELYTQNNRLMDALGITGENFRAAMPGSRPVAP